jgi:putative tricarboxylic transport membrane protein
VDQLQSSRDEDDRSEGAVATERPHEPSSWPYRVMCGCLMGLGLYVAFRARQMGFTTEVGPGPGFMPFWLGSALFGLALLLLVTSYISKPSGQEELVPERGALVQMVITIGAIGLFALFLESAGFVPVMFLVLAILLIAHGARRPLVIGAVAIAGSLGVGYAFTQWLGVFLPPTAYGLLAGIGL